MSQDYLNRRKVRGLTKLGRMVSEDPDIDNLLSNLSPEELEEVEKEVMKVPGPDPSEITIVDQTDSQSAKNSRGTKSDTASNDSRKSLQRNMSVEVWPRYQIPLSAHLTPASVRSLRSESVSSDRQALCVRTVGFSSISM